MGLSQDKILEYGAKLIIIFMVIPLHEFAHAWAADKLGDDTPRYQGRLTLNPFAHIDIFGALAIFFIGFGWGKPVQINPNRFKSYRKGNALCAAAGPISNLIAAFFGIIVAKIFYQALILNPFNQLTGWMYILFYYFTSINLGLAVFNLIPIPPLDGSKVLACFTSYKFDAFMAKYYNYIVIGFIALVFTGLLDRPLGYLNSWLYMVMDKLTFWVEPILSAIMN